MKYMPRAQLNAHKARERMRALRGEKLRPIGERTVPRAEECAACGYVHCACHGGREYIHAWMTAHEYASMWDRLATVAVETKEGVENHSKPMKLEDFVGPNPRLKVDDFIGPNPKLRQWEPFSVFYLTQPGEKANPSGTSSVISPE